MTIGLGDSFAPASGVSEEAIVADCAVDAFEVAAVD